MGLLQNTKSKEEVAGKNLFSSHLKTNHTTHQKDGSAPTNYKPDYATSKRHSPADIHPQGNGACLEQASTSLFSFQRL